MANELMICKCGRPLTERYARELGMCIECKLERIRTHAAVRWTDDKTIERVQKNHKKRGRGRKHDDDLA